MKSFLKFSGSEFCSKCGKVIRNENDTVLMNLKDVEEFYNQTLI